MKSGLIWTGGTLFALGALFFGVGLFGPRQGDGFTNIGQIVFGVGFIVVGLIPLIIGLASRSKPPSGPSRD